MKKRQFHFGRTAFLAAAGAALLQVSAAASPLEDLNAIMEKQMEQKQPSLAEELVGWKELSALTKENGVQVQTEITLAQIAAYMMELPEQFGGELSMRINTNLDKKNKQWQFDGALSLDGEDFGNLSLYGNKEMLTLELPQLLSYPMGLRSGSFLEQYEGTVWEEMTGEVLDQDIELDFYPDMEKYEEVFSLVGDLKSVLEEGEAQLETALSVQTREDETYPGVTFYDVTYDLKTLMQLYTDMIEEMAYVLSNSPLETTFGVDELEADLDETFEESGDVLGENLVITYWVKNDLVTQISMRLDIPDGTNVEESTETAQENQAAGKEKEIVARIDLKYIFENPENPEAGIHVEAVGTSLETGEVYGMAISYINDRTDTSVDSSLSIKTDMGKDDYYGEIYHASFDASTGAWSAEMTVPGEEPEEDPQSGISVSGSFTDVEPGKSFTVVLDQLAVSAGGTEVPLLSGSVHVSAEPEAISAPEDVHFFADFTENEAYSMIFEVMANAENWMTEMGFVTEETGDEYSDEYDADAEYDENNEDDAEIFEEEDSAANTAS